MKILIDGDGCPVARAAADIGKKRNLEVVLVCDTAHSIFIEGVRTIVVDKGADSADFYLVNRVQRGDVVITQDYGLAAMALAKGGRCINQNGVCITAENIDGFLLRRHIGREIRSAGGRTKGPAKRTEEDNKSFAAALCRLLDRAEEKGGI